MGFTHQVVSSLSSVALLASVGTLGGRAIGPQQSLLPPPVPAETTPKTLTLEDRADIFMARKEYSDAIDLYYRVLRQQDKTGPASAEVWNKIGIAYQQQDVSVAARKAYEKAEHVNPKFAEAWNNLGTTYFFQRKYKKSVKYYQHAIALDPNSPSFHVNLGTSYTHMRRYPKAVDEYRVALTLDPTILTEHGPNGTVMEPRSVDADYYYYLAKVFASLGRVPEAVRYLQHAFEMGFDNFKELDRDPDFLKISKDPAYAAFRKNPPSALKD